jgi:hypothetical protein
MRRLVLLAAFASLTLLASGCMVARRFRFSREHELTRAGFCGRCGSVIKDNVLVREGI